MRSLISINDEEVSVDLRKIRDFFLARKKLFFYGTLFGLFLGLGWFYFRPERYETHVYFRVEVDESAYLPNQTNLFQQFSNLLSGPSPSNTKKVINDLVEESWQSLDFLLSMVKKEIYFSSLDSSMYLVDYFVERAPFPIGEDSVARLYGIGDGKSYKTMVSERDIYAIGQLREHIAIKIEQRKLLLTVSMADRHASFHLAERFFDALSQYIVDYRTLLESMSMEYTTQQFQRAREEYEASRQEQALFEAKNRSITSPMVKIDREKMAMEVRFKYRIYTELGVEHEKAKMALQNKRPIITIVEPAAIPQEKTRGSMFMVVLFFILGSVLAVFLIVGGELLLRLFGYQHLLRVFESSKKRKHES